ncbi:ThiF family adenylyltransferase [Ralstonia wenshanensis]|uniref:ThiF family adenylyltransferase n=1 Tax=Ralstonia wenshanensis TaxID=2842456 RepID=UPI0021B30360|nr:ThiF family adenylyltransferase [Ralstonia wenshanensis]MCT7306239.1 ThiF family adenylyltransferase [Ralstonia wenshanensis]
MNGPSPEGGIRWETYLADHPDLLPEVLASNERRERRFPIRLPPMQDGRGFESAWLVLPRGFPVEPATIRLSKDAILTLPHVEFDGKLCIGAEAGVGSGASVEERLSDFLDRFKSDFLKPWLAGQLDSEFVRETRNYWDIHVGRFQTARDPIRKVYLLDERVKTPKVYEAKLTVPGRAVIAGENSSAVQRLAASFGWRASQLRNVMIAEIPVTYDFEPNTWPQSLRQLELLLTSRLTSRDRKRFSASQKQFRVVLLRSPNCTYGLLLPGGPAVQIKEGRATLTVRNTRLQPLLADRIDPMWTCGRDQHAEVLGRQKAHVLVFGVGALGSLVVDQLARAGLGKISLVDSDCLSTANIGRHLLGVDSVGFPKAKAVARHVERNVHSCELVPYAVSAEQFLSRYDLSAFDVVLDLTGEPDVRARLEQSRLKVAVPLLVAWMEPYVAAAHACLLTAGTRWMHQGKDPLNDIQAVRWPADVIQREPGCSSQFQSYTHSAAAYAIGLVSEAALDLIDGDVTKPLVRSWVRGQQYLDDHFLGLRHESWAMKAADCEGVRITRGWGDGK